MQIVVDVYKLTATISLYCSWFLRRTGDSGRIAFKLEFISGSDRDLFLERLDHESKVLRNLIKRL